MALAPALDLTTTLRGDLVAQGWGTGGGGGGGFHKCSAARMFRANSGFSTFRLLLVQNLVALHTPAGPKLQSEGARCEAPRVLAWDNMGAHVYQGNTGITSMVSILVMAYVRIGAPSFACHVVLCCCPIVDSIFLFVQPN